MFTIYSTAARWNFLYNSLAFFILFLTTQGGRKESARGGQKGKSAGLSAV